MEADVVAAFTQASVAPTQGTKHDTQGRNEADCEAIKLQKTKDKELKNACIGRGFCKVMRAASVQTLRKKQGPQRTGQHAVLRFNTSCSSDRQACASVSNTSCEKREHEDFDCTIFVDANVQAAAMGGKKARTLWQNVRASCPDRGRMGIDAQTDITNRLAYQPDRHGTVRHHGTSQDGSSDAFSEDEQGCRKYREGRRRQLSTAKAIR
eukprot:6111823-Amphidinium_carterae.6